MKKKLHIALEAIIRYFLVPLIIQVAVVHVTIGIFVSMSLIGRTLLLHESALIALSLVVCQTIQTQTVSFRFNKRKKQTNIKMVKSEVIR